MKTTTKWTRIRPGLYRNGAHALVERGAETSRWWWSAYSTAHGWHSDWQHTLRDAQVDATNYMERPE
jgi:hypothetical protein